MNKLTQKELAARWGVTVRTVQREVRRWGLAPADYIGIQPVFLEADVEAMEERRRKQRTAEIFHRGMRAAA